MAFLNQQKSSQLARCPGHISLAFCRVCKLLWIFFSLFFFNSIFGGHKLICYPFSFTHSLRLSFLLPHTLPPSVTTNDPSGYSVPERHEASPSARGCRHRRMPHDRHCQAVVACHAAPTVPVTPLLENRRK